MCISTILQTWLEWQGRRRGYLINFHCKPKLEKTVGHTEGLPTYCALGATRFYYVDDRRDVAVWLVGFSLKRRMSIAPVVLPRVLENRNKFGDAGGLMRKRLIRHSYFNDEMDHVRDICDSG